MRAQVVAAVVTRPVESSRTVVFESADGLKPRSPAKRRLRR